MFDFDVCFRMFRSIFKLLWGHDQDTLNQTETDIDLSDHTDYECTKTFEGTVSLVTPEYGMVDNDVYFSRRLWDHKQPLDVGTRVSVDAERKHEEAGWVATSVRPVTEASSDYTNWCDAEESETNDVVEKKDMVAEVTYFRRSKGSLNSRIQFELADCADCYQPARGDWVSCTLAYNSVCGQTVSDVKPLRTSTYEGKITGLHTDYGFINDDIYFLRGSCLDGYAPRRDDRVCGDMIEFGGRRHQNWRATTVRPIRNIPDQHIK